MIAPETRLAHKPQLDGLRALAVTAVLVQHFAGGYIETGALASSGVQLFFVLSGFLITGILLVARDGVSLGRSSPSDALKNFYVRRVLRIFPIYYLIVIGAIVLDVGPARDLAWWLLSYTLNLKMATQGWFEETFAHFWSLNVEEQFYIVWPWVVLLLPERWLMPATIATIAATPLWKIAYVLSGYMLVPGLGTYIGTWACLDSLGIGALAALLRHRRSPLAEPRRWPAMAAAIFGGALLWIAPAISSDTDIVLANTGKAMFFAWLILAAADGIRGPVGVALEWKPVMFIGRISYGLYVYHPLVPGMIAYLWLKITGTEIVDDGRFLIACVIATLAISSASWFAIEKPILRLKGRFR